MKNNKNFARNGKKKLFGRPQTPRVYFEDVGATFSTQQSLDPIGFDNLADVVAETADEETKPSPGEVPKSELSSSKPFSAGKSAASGVRWNTISIVLIQLMTIARSIILARLLSREDFGLMGMAASVQAGFELFTNFGLQNTIVSGKYEDDKELHRHINTVFTVEIIRSAILTLILVAVSIPASRFYNDDRLAPILMITCLTPLIASFRNMGLSLLSREAKFRERTIYGIISAFLTILASLVIAFWRRDVWALVWGQMAAAVISVALSYLYHPYRPRFQLDPVALRSSLKFGQWFIVISAMYYVTSTADNIFVGKLLGPEELGAYLVAYNVANLPSSLVSKGLGNVLFPIFSRLGRDDASHLRSAVSRVLVLGSSALMLMIVPMVVLVPDLITVFYGTKWEAAVPPLRILLFVGLFRALIQLISPIMMSLNRPDMEGKSKIVEAGVFLAILYPLVAQFGTLGAAWAGVVIYFIALLIRYSFANTLVPGAFSALFTTSLGVGAAALLGALCGTLLFQVMGGALPIVRLLVIGPIILMVTSAFLLLFLQDLRQELEKMGVNRRLRAWIKRA